MMRSKILLSGLTGTALVYSFSVEYHKYKVLNKSPIDRQFYTGSTDSLIYDNLNTGDLVLFSRIWYRHHIPTACMIIYNHFTEKSEFDQVGMIVIDNNGEPQVLEYSNQFGARVTPLDTRVHYSDESQIIVAPIVPRISFDTIKTFEMLSKPTRAYQRNFLHWVTGPSVHASIRTLCYGWQTLGLECTDGPPTITNLVDGQVTFTRRAPSDPGEQNGKPISISKWALGDHVLIRSS